MEEPSEMLDLDPAENPESPQTEDEREDACYGSGMPVPAENLESPQTEDEQEDSCYDSDIAQPEAVLAKHLRKLTLNSSAKKAPSTRLRGRRRRPRRPVPKEPVRNRSEEILREVQSAFPKRRVRTLLSVLRDPVAKMKRFIRIEKKLRSVNGNEYEESSEPFRCLCTFCLYQGWDPSENAKIGQ